MKKDKRKKKKAQPPKRNKYITMLRECAQLGDAKALYSLGVEYALGEAVKENDEKAFECFYQSATRGHAKAMVTLGSYYVTGKGCERNLDEAKRWFKQAASLGETKAAELLKNLDNDYLMIGADQDELADKERRSKQGDSQATYDLFRYYDSIREYRQAQFYYDEAIRLKSPQILMDQGYDAQDDGDVIKAIDCFEEAVKQDWPDAYVALGQIINSVDVTAEGKKKAIQFLKKARDLGSEDASPYLARICYLQAVSKEDFAEVLTYAKEGIVSDPGYMSDIIQMYYDEKIYDDKTLLHLSQEMAEQGDDVSVSRLAYMYLKGEGTPKDLKAGLSYLKKARDYDDYTGAWLIDILAASPRDLDQAFAKYAKHCDRSEYVQIGECYLEGVAVEQNIERGLSYINDAAKRKVPRAMALLGEMYLFGHYVEKDLEQAIDLLKKAAKYEEPRALILLSRCYQLGLGVEQDEEASDFFYDRFQDAG